MSRVEISIIRRVKWTAASLRTNLDPQGGIYPIGDTFLVKGQRGVAQVVQLGSLTQHLLQYPRRKLDKDHFHGVNAIMSADDVLDGGESGHRERPPRESPTDPRRP